MSVGSLEYDVACLARQIDICAGEAVQVACAGEAVQVTCAGEAVQVTCAGEAVQVACAGEAVQVACAGEAVQVACITPSSCKMKASIAHWVRRRAGALM